MKNLATHLKIAIGCLIFGFITSSFWGGFSCVTGIKTFGDRIQLGLIWILLSAAKLGRLTIDPLRTKLYNVWPLALVITLVTEILVYLFMARKKKLTSASA